MRLKEISIRKLPSATKPYTLSSRSKMPSHDQNLSKSMSFANAFLPTLKTIFFGNSSVSIEQIYNYKRLIMNEHQQITMYIKNRQNTSNFKGCSPLQLSYSLTGKCHAVGYYSYTKCYAPLNRN